MFTVKQLSRLAGVTPRTLHYYDEIRLLQPTRVADNGYRYYGEDAVLRLQQILLFRELDMPLEEIRQILGRQDFDVLGSLEQHKQELRRRIARMERLVTTVDRTLDHLKGTQTMSKQQFFEGFSDEQQAKYAEEAAQMYDPATVKASNQRWKSYSAAEKQRILAEGNAVYADMLSAMPAGAGSPQAQACVARWRQNIEHFWVPDEPQLLGLVDMYSSDPRFKANFDRIDAGLADFMRAAVTIYVNGRKQA